MTSFMEVFMKSPLIILGSFLLIGCGLGSPGETASTAPAAVTGGANAFNPWMNASLPNLRETSDEGRKMLENLGATPQSIEGEAAYRKNWREEIYPVVFGKKDASNEVIVVLDFASPQSEKVWREVADASRSLNGNNCKIVVFGRSGEPYGTDLMGFAIWILNNRPDQVMSYLSYALERWNVVKAAQKSAGKVKKFTNEYDATASASDYPIIYTWFGRLKPPVPVSQELAVSRYAYNAGNVNMYQASQVCKYYGVNSLPAVIVNGKPLANPSAQGIIAAVNQGG